MKDSTVAKRAIARAIPDTFADAIVAAAPRVPVDVELARRQHRAYVQALESVGLAVSVLPAANEFPDSCFVEDCAVVAGGVALAARSAAPSRRGEESAIAKALRPFARIERMSAPGTLDGGDCLRVGRRWFVGLSARTNAVGARQMAEVFGPLGIEVVEVPVGRLLHLKCACSYLGDGKLLLADDTIPPHIFGELQVIPVPAVEAYAANCVSVNGHVLMSAGYPATRRGLKAAGLRVQELDTSEFQKGGRLIDLSVDFAGVMRNRALNRAVKRSTLFESEDDFAAFVRVLSAKGDLGLVRPTKQTVDRENPLMRPSELKSSAAL